MGDIISISGIFTKERVDTMDRISDKIIDDLRKKNAYEDMPGAADALLALLSGDEYPVPVVEVAKKLGFKVFDGNIEEKELSGMISIDQQWEKTYGTRKIIVVNKNDSSGHKRFTIAHELAHYLFDAVPGQKYANTYRTDESRWSEGDADIRNREKVANYFAANLLMPSVAFRRKYNELVSEEEWNSEGIRRALSVYFGVPETAVGIRYKELGIS